MRRPPRGLLLSLSALPLACASAPEVTRPALETAPPPRVQCAFLGADPDRNQGCDPSAFLDDQVDLLVRKLERDPDWGALVSPELEAEGRLVVVANVVPSLDYLRREEEVSGEVARVVSKVRTGLANRLFRRSLTLEGPGGEPVQVDFQEGQLRGAALNDYMEYLEQVGQGELPAPFLAAYEGVELTSRAARTGLLWLVSAKEALDGSVELELRIKTFEMELGPDGRTLAVRGQMADRTGQLLTTIYTTWTNGRVYEPGHAPAARPSAPEVVEAAAPETPPSAEPRSPEAPEAAPTRDPVLWVTVARVQSSAEGPAELSFGRAALPAAPDRFALVFINPHPEPFPFIFGPASGPLSVRVASDGTDRSAVAPARRPEDVAVAMSSVFTQGSETGPYLLVLRRRQPWSLEEQGRARWTCEPASTYRLGDLPKTRRGGTLGLAGWVRRELAGLLGADLADRTDAVSTEHFFTLPLDRIPSGEGGGDALCIVLPFSSPRGAKGDV